MSVARRARLDWFVACAVAAVAAILYPRALFRGESFIDRDLVVDWYQRVLVLAQCLREGSWPLWDLSMGFGYPLLADSNNQILYPPAWAAFAMPLSVGYTLFVVGHLLLGAIGTRRLASTLGAGQTGAVAAGCLWAVSGPIQSALNLRAHLAGSAWLPWVLLATERAVRAPRLASALRLAFVVSLQFLAGSPDVFMMTALLSAGWVCVRVVGTPRRWRRTGASLVAAAALSAGITALQWWPALDVLSRSPRRSMPEDVRTFWSTTPRGLLRSVVPLDHMRVPFTMESWTQLFGAPEPPLLWSIYLGAPALLVSLLALSGGGRRTIALASFAVFATGFTLGPHVPLYGWATTLLPVLRALRYPSKAFLVVSPLVALLAGIGLSRIARGHESRQRSLAFAVLGAFLGGASFVAGRGFAPPGAWAAGPAFAIAAGLVLGLLASAALKPRFAALTLSVLGVCDLALAHRELNATGPIAAILRPPATVALVDRSEHRRVYVYNYHSVRGTSERYLGRLDPLPVVAQQAPVSAALRGALASSLYLLAPRGGLYGLEESYNFDWRGLSSREMNDLDHYLRLVEGTPVHVTLLRMGAVGTVVSLHRRGFEGLELRHLVPGVFPEPVHIWRVPNAMPRSWLVGCAETADHGPALATIARSEFDPAREVVLADGAVGGICGPAGTVRIVALLADRMRLEVEAARSGWVVAADAYDPGWQATLDGRPVPLHRANLAFRAVAVPQGRHQVEMVYRPRSVLLGLGLSLASILTGVVLVVSARGRRASAARAS